MTDLTASALRDPRWIALITGGPEREALTLYARDWRRVAPNPLFDPAFYLSAHPDLAAWEGEPLAHYLTHGATEGRLPSPGFDPTRGPLLAQLAEGGARGAPLMPGTSADAGRMWLCRPGWMSPAQIARALPLARATVGAADLVVSDYDGPLWSGPGGLQSGGWIDGDALRARQTPATAITLDQRGMTAPGAPPVPWPRHGAEVTRIAQHLVRSHTKADLRPPLPARARAALIVAGVPGVPRPDRPGAAWADLGALCAMGGGAPYARRLVGTIRRAARRWPALPRPATPAGELWLLLSAIRPEFGRSGQFETAMTLALATARLDPPLDLRIVVTADRGQERRDFGQSGPEALRKAFEAARAAQFGLERYAPHPGLGLNRSEALAVLDRMQMTVLPGLDAPLSQNREAMAQLVADTPPRAIISAGDRFQSWLWPDLLRSVAPVIFWPMGQGNRPLGRPDLVLNRSLPAGQTRQIGGTAHRGLRHMALPLTARNAPERPEHLRVMTAIGNGQIEAALTANPDWAAQVLGALPPGAVWECIGIRTPTDITGAHPALARAEREGKLLLRAFQPDIVTHVASAAIYLQPPGATGGGTALASAAAGRAACVAHRDCDAAIALPDAALPRSGDDALTLLGALMDPEARARHVAAQDAHLAATQGLEPMAAELEQILQQAISSAAASG